MSSRVIDIDACRPRHCALGDVPHGHCACGLPIEPGRLLCRLCEQEGLTTFELAPYKEDEDWDGRSYPSRRANRRLGPHPEPYEKLVLATLAPEAWERESRRWRW